MNEKKCKLLKEIQAKYGTIYNLLEIGMNLTKTDTTNDSSVLQMTGKQINMVEHLFSKIK